jgi:hypothetical protein
MFLLFPACKNTAEFVSAVFSNVVYTGNDARFDKDNDASFLTTEKAGGFVGATVGMYATSAHRMNNRRSER